MFNIKKLVTIFMALMLLLACCVPAMASDQTDNANAASSDNGLFVYSKQCPAEYDAFAKEKIGDLLASPDYADIGNAEIEITSWIFTTTTGIERYKEMLS